MCIRDRDRTIVFARGFKEVYNPLVVAKAFESIDSQLEDYNFILCGEGPLKTESERILSYCKNVQFTGQISENELAGIVGKAQLVISPSLSDSIPLTILEAVASGTPVVASNILANQKWVDAGLPVTIFDKNSAEDLSLKISEIVTNDRDRTSGKFFVSFAKEDQRRLFKIFGGNNDDNNSSGISFGEEAEFEITIIEKDKKSYVRAISKNGNIEQSEQLLSKINESLS